LTFDTDSALGYTSGILDTLEAYGVPASFGVTGIWAQAHPDLLQRMVRDGDTVMNHSWDHPDFTKITKEQRLAELQMTEDAVQAAAGVTTKPYFRPPYGVVDASVRADVAEDGYITVLWNIDPQGWRGKSALEVEANVFANARDGGIALFHVGAYGDYQALGPIIETLWDAGYLFVTVGEILGVPPATPTPTPSTAASPTVSPTPTPTATPSSTPSATVTATPELTATPSAGHIYPDGNRELVVGGNSVRSWRR
jgi:peptidoglycan/xylan/chitin deacetylase (PgdA/CDA1 family)